MDRIIAIPKVNMLELLDNKRTSFYDRKNYSDIKIVITDSYTEITTTDNGEILELNKVNFASVLFDRSWFNDDLTIIIGE